MSFYFILEGNKNCRVGTKKKKNKIKNKTKKKKKKKHQQTKKKKKKKKKKRSVGLAETQIFLGLMSINALGTIPGTGKFCLCMAYSVQIAIFSRRCKKSPPPSSTSCVTYALYNTLLRCRFISRFTDEETCHHR